MSALKIGDEIWTIDPRDRRTGWERSTIVDETKMSWLVRRHTWGEPTKVNKKTMLQNHGPQWGSQRWYSAEEKVAREFIDAHRYRIIDRLKQEYRDVDMPLTVVASQLKQIAEILGLELPCNPAS